MSTTQISVESLGPEGSPPSPTIERAIEVVKGILESGGEEALRLADVKEKSGVSIGSLYHHFGSRSGLIAAARERQFRDGLTYRQQIDANGYLASSTPEEFIAVFDEMLRTSESEEAVKGRQRRFELIGAAAPRSDDLSKIAELESAYLSAGEKIGQELYSRGWLKEGVEPRAFALFLHSVSMSRVVRDLDGGVSPDAWRLIARRALEGLLVLGRD